MGKLRKPTLSTLLRKRAREREEVANMHEYFGQWAAVDTLHEYGLELGCDLTDTYRSRTVDIADPWQRREWGSIRAAAEEAEATDADWFSRSYHAITTHNTAWSEPDDYATAILPSTSGRVAARAAVTKENEYRKLTGRPGICMSGHEMTVENSYQYKPAGMNSVTQCRACNNARRRARTRAVATQKGTE